MTNARKPVSRSSQPSLKDKLKVERIINFFAMSLLEQSTVEEVLWDVVKNCIGRLHFVDCVIYRLDESRNVLVQQAAYGPKSPAMGVIHQPIEIPLGQGIVGEVAMTGRPERIGNTALDSRYITDDAVRLSELTVPIYVEGRVWGILDAEHPKRNFFRPYHLTILTKIAALCAQKIRRVAMEQAYQQAKQQLAANNQRLAEAKLLALRMQMNPHFVFNSLNAINKFVLQNESEQASLYLTKFSNLMRQVMLNTTTEWVSLRNELKALQLYIELEQLRCDHQFDYVLTVSKSLDTDTVCVPPLITYPYVENAIRHGLLHQRIRKATLRIDCRLAGSYVRIQIADNGIGRAAAARTQQNGLTAHKSYGHSISAERLHLVNERYSADAHIDVTDLYTATGDPAGTCVTFTIKRQTP